eukprot:1656798-Rhodomonas_salina.1
MWRGASTQQAPGRLPANSIPFAVGCSKDSRSACGTERAYGATRKPISNYFGLWHEPCLLYTSDAADDM